MSAKRELTQKEVVSISPWLIFGIIIIIIPILVRAVASIRVANSKGLPKPRQSADSIVEMMMGITISTHTHVIVSHAPNGCGKHCTPLEGTIVGRPTYGGAYNNEIVVTIRPMTSTSDKKIVLFTRNAADSWDWTGWHVQTIKQPSTQHR